MVPARSTRTTPENRVRSASRSSASASERMPRTYGLAARLSHNGPMRTSKTRAAAGSVALLCLMVPALATPGATAADEAQRGRTLRVGPGRALTTPSAAAAVARNGDTVLIDAGTYAGDVATWTQDDLTLRAVGGRA